MDGRSSTEALSDGETSFSTVRRCMLCNLLYMLKGIPKMDMP